MYRDGGEHGGDGLARRVRTVMMKIAGKSRVASRSRLISLAVIFLAAALAFYAFHESNIHPTSSDSSIDADIVHIAAAVGGRIIKLPVSENARVSPSALLFLNDPLPCRHLPLPHRLLPKIAR